jgi:ABC-2 type transport system ATP-binding protein
MTTTSPPALKVTGLRKSFGEKTVLDGIDLDVAEGTTFSLLGPNGAGKTTTVQMDNLLTGEENLLLMADLHHLDRREGRRRA